MSESASLRQIEQAIEGSDETELRRAEMYCRTKIAIAPETHDDEAEWRVRLGAVRARIRALTRGPAGRA
jgi:hypothetical protein